MRTTSADTLGVKGLAVGGLLISAFALSVVALGSADDSHFWASDVNCNDCHQSGVLAPSGTAAPAVMTHLDLDCTVCHDSHGTTSNLHLVREVIETTSSGPRDVIFIQKTGQNSYADGDAVYDGVCEVCHTTTLYHRNDPSGDHTHNAATQCTDCHPHGAGFSYTPPTSVIGEGEPSLSIRVYPSPSRGPVTILVAAPMPGEAVRAAICDVHGRVIRELGAESLQGGRAVLHWDGRNQDGSSAGSGVYFCRVEAAGQQLRSRFLIVR
jgi:hypothetical protein